MRAQQQTAASFMHAADASARGRTRGGPDTHLHLDFNMIHCRNDESRHTDVFANAAQRFHQSCCYRAGALTSARGSTARFSVMMSDPAHALALRRHRPEHLVLRRRRSSSGVSAEVKLGNKLLKCSHLQLGLRTISAVSPPPRCGVSKLPSHWSSMFVLNSLVSALSLVSETSPRLHRCATPVHSSSSCPFARLH